MTVPTKTIPLKNTIATVACVFEVAPGAVGTVPTEAHLLPRGFFRAQDGRPKECAAWYLDDSNANQVIARALGRSNDFLIDYEHQSLYTEDNGQPALAAGWFKGAGLQWRDAGLYATGIDWTPEGAKRISNKELRYISTVFTYYETTGEVLEIISATLTNSPALDGLDDLAVLTKKLTVRLTQQKGKAMAEEVEKLAALTAERDTAKTQVAALTVERDDLKTKVAALTTERDTYKTQLDALEAEKQTAALTLEREQCSEMITAALTAGKIVPAVKPLLDKLNKAELTVYLTETAGVELALLTKQHQKQPGTGVAALTQEELAMCKKMNVSPEDYLTTKGSD